MTGASPRPVTPALYVAACLELRLAAGTSGHCIMENARLGRVCMCSLKFKLRQVWRHSNRIAWNIVSK